MDVGHEALEFAIEQVRTLAAERLGDQEPYRGVTVECRWMELDELHVGDLRARPPCRCNAVAGGDSRVRRHAIDLA